MLGLSRDSQSYLYEIVLPCHSDPSISSPSEEAPSLGPGHLGPAQARRKAGLARRANLWTPAHPRQGGNEQEAGRQCSQSVSMISHKCP